MKKSFSRIFLASLLVLGLSATLKAEDKNFLVKGNLGWNIYPGLTGFLLYGEAPFSEAFGYTSGLSLNAEFFYFFNSWLAVGLNAAFLPFFHFQDVGSVTASCELIPVIAQVQVYPAKFFYLNLGLGLGFIHGSGSTTSSSMYFFDLIAGQSTGQSFNVMRGPYFLISYGLGFQIDLTGQDNFGIDIFTKFYDVFGHPGLDQLATLTEQYAKIPGFLVKFMFNTGVGVYFRF